MADARSLIARFRNEKPKSRAERDYMRSAGDVSETWWVQVGKPEPTGYGHHGSNHSHIHGSNSALRPVGELHTRTAPLQGRASAWEKSAGAASDISARGDGVYGESRGSSGYEDGFGRGYDMSHGSVRGGGGHVGSHGGGSSRNYGGGHTYDHGGGGSHDPGSHGNFGGGFSAVDDVVFGDVQRLDTTVTRRTTQVELVRRSFDASDDDDDSLDGYAVPKPPPRPTATAAAPPMVRSAARFRFVPSRRPPPPPETHAWSGAGGGDGANSGYRHHGEEDEEGGEEGEASWEQRSAARAHARRPVYAVSASMLRGAAGLTSGAQLTPNPKGGGEQDKQQPSSSSSSSSSNSANGASMSSSAYPSAFDASQMLDSTLALLQEKLNSGGDGGSSGGAGWEPPSSYGGGFGGGYGDGSSDELPQSIAAVREKLESGMLCFNLLYASKVI
jgi:hypothetical protein